MRINHNTLALNANNHLNTTDKKLSTAIERLSSGYKINKAADDAAGMAISQKMQTQINALSRANDNAGDGISLVQTAEGSLDEMHSILKRMRELSVQAANDTFDETDLLAIQTEIDQLRDEIDKISEDTQFNGISLLNGEADRTTYASNKAYEITAITDGVDNSKYNFELTAIGTYAEYNGTTFAGNSGTRITAEQAGEVKVNGVSVEINENDTIESAYEKLRDAFDRVDLEIYPTKDGGATSTTIDDATSLSVKSLYAGTAESIDISVTNPQLGAVLGISDSVTYGTDASIELTVEDGGFTNTATITAHGNDLIITDRNGFEMKMSIDDTKATVGDETELTVLSAGRLVLQVGADEGQVLNVALPKVTAKTLGIDKVNINTHELASSAIDMIDSAIENISSIRSKIGAYQNRLDHTMDNLDVSEENLTTAVSRITDTDMAEEMAAYTQYNVLSQAATEMLGKANARPESLLQLLQ